MAAVSTGLSDPRFQDMGAVDDGACRIGFGRKPDLLLRQPAQIEAHTFLGTTGNPQRLIQFLARHYGFRRLPSGDAGSPRTASVFRIRGS